MIKKNKGKAILSSLLIFLPTLAGILMWDHLPDQMIVHWGADGTPDNTGAKAMVVFGFPCLMLVIHWFCLLITAKDPSNQGHNEKNLGLLFWIIPVISLASSSLVYQTAFGREITPDRIPCLVIALFFILLGNYMPKVKQNHTYGVKVIWALRNEENWNKTHRFSGKLWMTGGLIILASMLLPMDGTIWVMIITLLILAVAPILYSYRIHRKGQKDPGYMAQQIPLPPHNTQTTKIALFFTAAILLFVGALMFTGDIEISYGETAFQIDASYWNDLEVDYTKIGTITYREDLHVGVRSNGYGSPRLSMGTFRNDEFGTYTLYAYTGCESYVVLTQDEHVLVIGGKDEAATRAIYETLNEKLGN